MSTIAMLPRISTPRFFKGRRLSGTNEGLGGVYFVRTPSFHAKSMIDNDSDVEYVFKPRQEEPRVLPGSFDPPVQFGQSSPLKRGVRVGDSSVKEYAAYVLDKDGRAGVPSVDILTAHVDLEDEFESGAVEGFGSLHSFVRSKLTSEDIGSSVFACDNVHWIGLFDTRICNLDRHEGNLLVREGDNDEKILVPIDHGFSLPSWQDISDAYFCWVYWKQAAQPFSEEAIEYVANLRPLDDVLLLLTNGIKPECILTYVLCSLFTKCAVAAGKTLRDIALLIQRDMSTPNELSQLERMVRDAARDTDFSSFVFSDNDNCWSSSSMSNFLLAFVTRMRTALNVKDQQDLLETSGSFD